MDNILKTNHFKHVEIHQSLCYLFRQYLQKLPGKCMSNLKLKSWTWMY